MSALLFPDELIHQLNHPFSDPFVGAREVFTERGHLILVQERSPRSRQTLEIAAD